MRKRKWSYTQENKSEFQIYKEQIAEVIKTLKASGKEYDVIIQDHEKSNDIVKKFDIKKDIN